MSGPATRPARLASCSEVPISAEELGAPREAADLLARAADLWESGADRRRAPSADARLLERACLACTRVGRNRRTATD